MKKVDFYTYQLGTAYADALNPSACRDFGDVLPQIAVRAQESVCDLPMCPSRRASTEVCVKEWGNLMKRVCERVSESSLAHTRIHIAKCSTEIFARHILKSAVLSADLLIYYYVLCTRDFRETFFGFSKGTTTLAKTNFHQNHTQGIHPTTALEVL